MTDFFRTEMNRLLDTLPKTDPASDEYHLLLRSIEGLGGISSFVADLDIDMGGYETKENITQISAFANAAEETPETTAEETPATTEEAPPEAAEEKPTPKKKKSKPGYTLEEVRAVAAAAKLKGVDICKILRAYNVRVISAVPKEKYPELLDTLNEKVAELVEPPSTEAK